MNKHIIHFETEPMVINAVDSQLVRLRSLWAAKLLAYLFDAVQKKKFGSGLNPKVARGWFGTYDFRETCYCAGVDPELVMQNFKKRMALIEEGRWAEAQEGFSTRGRKAQ